MKIKRNLFTIYSLLCALAFTSACASIEEPDRLFKTLKEKYDHNEYSACVSEGMEAIEKYEDDYIKSGEFKEIANIYEIIADCHERQGEMEKATEWLNRIVSDLGEKLPKDHVARIQLKVGNVYKHNGLYSKALTIYTDVEKTYAADFPDRFSRYARENREKILAGQVTLIKGRVETKDRNSQNKVTMQVFNGFEITETVLEGEGDYKIPLFLSTPGTLFVFSAVCDGYEPVVVTKVFGGSPEMAMENISLEKQADNTKAMVAGVIYTKKRGGKKRRVHGIAKVNEDKVVFEKMMENQSEDMVEMTIVVESAANGVYWVLLDPGTYFVKGVSMKRPLEIKQGESRMLNIRKGRILVD